MQKHVYHARKADPIPEKENNLNILSTQNHLIGIK